MNRYADKYTYIQESESACDWHELISVDDGIIDMEYWSATLFILRLDVWML